MVKAKLKVIPIDKAMAMWCSSWTSSRGFGLPEAGRTLTSLKAKMEKQRSRPTGVLKGKTASPRAAIGFQTQWQLHNKPHHTWIHFKENLEDRLKAAHRLLGRRHPKEVTR